MVGICSCFSGHKLSNSDEQNTTVKPPNSGEENTNIPGPSSSSVQTEHKQESEVVREFSYRDLGRYTNSFRSDSCIGEGGFGKVYKGKIVSTDQEIAVKKFKQFKLFNNEKNDEFGVEVSMLSRLSHPNLVKMIGYCMEGHRRLIVYEYMPMGSLEKHLFGKEVKEVLDWNTRLDIAIGAAYGLEYLHNQKPPVIHRDMKSSNILLTEDYQAKLSDFGLSKFGPTGEKTHVTTRVMGTRGYCCPEYYGTGKLTLMSDIYSFGVVMLELITGRPALETTNQGKEIILTDWARPMLSNGLKYEKLVDPRLKGGVLKESNLSKAIFLVRYCLREKKHERPDIGLVIEYLNYLKSCLSGPSNISKGDEGGPSGKGKEIVTDLKKGSNEGTMSNVSKGDEGGPSRKGKEVVTDLKKGSNNEGTLSVGMTSSEERKKKEEEREKEVAEAKCWAMRYLQQPPTNKD